MSHHHHHGPVDAAAWVDRLERADREAWQRPDEVVAALGLTGGETVFDVGAGSGYFTFRFARALPRGRVVAVDDRPRAPPPPRGPGRRRADGRT